MCICYNNYIHKYGKYGGTEHIRIYGVVLPEIATAPTPIFPGSGPEDNPYLISDGVTLDWRSLTGFGALRFKMSAKVGAYSDDDLFPYFRPFFGWTIKVECKNAAWAYLDESRKQCYITKSVGNDTTLYAFEVDNEILWASEANAEDYFKQNSPNDVPNIPGVGSCAFEDGNIDVKEYSIDTLPIFFEQDYDGDVAAQLLIYPMHARWWVVGTNWMKPSNTSFNLIDVYRAALQVTSEKYEFEETIESTLDDNNRENKSLSLYIDRGTPDYNGRFYNKYIPLTSAGVPVSDFGYVWSVGGVTMGSLVEDCLLPEIRSQYQIPRRKLTGKLLSDPDDMDFGKVLLDNSLIRYICTGVEFDLKNAYWEGEWLEVHDPNNMRLGDYDADDFDDTDFWAI